MENNPFLYKTGGNNLSNPYAIIGFIILSVIIGYFLVLSGISIAFALMVLPVLVIFLNKMFIEPTVGMTFLYVLNFILMGLTRYIPITLGYFMDIFLFLIFLSYFFKHFNVKLDMSPLKNDLVYLTILWFGYICLEIVNPEAVSFQAWLSAMRGEALYMLLVIPLVYLIFDKPKNLDTFMYIWGVLTLVATAKGLQQVYLHPDPFEQKWLDSGAAHSHILWGKLRVFSFFTDASQCGASQGQSGVLGILMFVNTKDFKKRIFWLIVGFAGLYTMAVSGTRSAIAVPAAGFFLYIFLKKNIKVIIIGSILMLGIVVFFKYTNIGSGNYQVSRMRTAFNPQNDASMNLRIINQRTFANYLKTRPIGGGVGHAGIRAQKFVPYGYLAHIATDSWFVMIWAECGIIGLFVHLFVIFYIFGKGAYIIMFRLKNQELIGKLSTLLCGMFGIIAASYSNSYLGQFPTHIIVFTSMVYIFLGPKLEKQLELEAKEKEQQLLNSNQLILE